MKVTNTVPYRLDEFRANDTEQVSLCQLLRRRSSEWDMNATLEERASVRTPTQDGG
jgi:hypothetical protein